MLPVLEIQLLGDFRLVYGDEPSMAVDTPRLQSLLAYLVLHRSSPLPRSYVAFTFWPDSTETQAMTNLRHLLHDLRHVLPAADRCLRADRKTMAWLADSPFRLDVADFHRALKQARTSSMERVSGSASRDAFVSGSAGRDGLVSGSANRDALVTAVHLYRGDLLPSCYDEWIEPVRERLREEYVRALELLICRLEDERDYATAMQYVGRLLQQEQLRESAYVSLMRLRALNGDRSGALRAYEECARVLQQELNVHPGPSTRRLYERLLGSSEPLIEPTTSRVGQRFADFSLVGRHDEWQRLKRAWRTASGGRASFVVVMGEAGIGKTRLVGELVECTARQGRATAKTRSYAAEGRLAYAPVADWLRSDALIAPVYRLSPVWLGEVSRVLPELRLERSDLPEPAPVRENWQRLRLFEALARAVLAGGAPLLLVLDDMQWTDPETLAWLRYLLRFAPEAPLLIAGTIRTEEMDAEPALGSLISDLRREGMISEIVLSPLDASDTASMAEQVAGAPFDEAKAVRLYEETEGNPLFIVESIRSGLLDATSSDSSLPSKIYAVITSRLAQLSPQARALGGLAATVGRVFTLEVLAAAATLDDESLTSALDELWQRHIIREHRAGVYDFSHDKLREVAYAELSPVRRRLLHQRVALAFETLYDGDDLDAFCGRLAAHYEQAGNEEQALRYYHRAGRLAQEVHAVDEAIRLFSKALSLLEDLPESSKRDETELALQTDLGACLVSARGYAASEVRHVYDRALVLCERLNKPADPPVLRGLAIANLVGGDPHRARLLGEGILSQADASRDAVLEVEGHYVLGVTNFWMGHFSSSRQHLEQAILRYVPRQHGVHVSLYAQDPKVVCLSRLARTLWHLGNADLAARRAEESLSLARILGHPSSRAYALCFSAQLYFDRGDLQSMRGCLDELRPLIADQGMALWESYGNILEGIVRVEQGILDPGIRLMREGMASYIDSGGYLVLPEFHGYCAQAYMKLKANDEALSALEDGLALAQRTSVVFRNAELLRLKGEVKLESGSDEEAETLFRLALETARRQDARMLMIRAAVPLAQMHHRKGQVDEARHLLCDVLGGFTESFETCELRTARRLLDVWTV